MIVFFFVPMLEFPYRPIIMLTSFVIYLPYRLTSSDATKSCFCLNWWVEKHQRFLFNVYKRFFNFCHVFYVFNVFFLERFFYIHGLMLPPNNRISIAPYSRNNELSNGRNAVVLQSHRSQIVVVTTA